MKTEDEIKQIRAMLKTVMDFMEATTRTSQYQSERIAALETKIKALQERQKWKDFDTTLEKTA